MGSDSLRRSENTEFYGDYYHKPWWWFRLRYASQIKRKTVLWLLRQRQFIPSNKQVLEIGFGSGEVLFSLGRDCHIAGVEVSHSAVEHAAARANELGFAKADFRMACDDLLPFPDKAFDVVIASHVLEHVSDDTLLISEMGRVLKDDGIVIVVIPINEKYIDPKHLRHFTSKQLRDLLVSGGFDPILIIENDLLYHIVDKFYSQGFKERWGVLGWLVSIGFNIPTAIMPFPLLRLLDGCCALLGVQPRQCSVAAMRAFGARPSIANNAGH